MPKIDAMQSLDLEELDRFYRAGGLRNMASPHIHYPDGVCPHPGCSQRMEWIDFQLELFGDAEGIYKPLVLAWWDGRGFVGKCPTCSGLDSLYDLGNGSRARRTGYADAEVARELAHGRSVCLMDSM